MGYYFRVFCTADTVPPLPEVLAWVRDRGVAMTSEGEQWRDVPVPIHYTAGAPPFTAEVNRNTGEDSLAAQETREFMQMLEEMKKSRKRDRTLEHLRQTKFIVACEIPTTADFSDTGFHALDVFLAYFLVHSGGMVQADGQGFYEAGKLIIELAA